MACCPTIFLNDPVEHTPRVCAASHYYCVGSQLLTLWTFGGYSKSQTEIVLFYEYISLLKNAGHILLYVASLEGSYKACVTFQFIVLLLMMAYMRKCNLKRNVDYQYSGRDFILQCSSLHFSSWILLRTHFKTWFGSSWKHSGTLKHHNSKSELRLKERSLFKRSILQMIVSKQWNTTESIGKGATVLEFKIAT